MTAPAAIVTTLTPLAAGTRMESPAASDRGADIRCLTAALVTGDEAAFRRFHAAYFDRLLRYLFVVTRGDEEAARDALQETLARVVRHIRPFDSDEAFWGWLTVLARSAAADAGRKRTRYWRLLAHYSFFRKTTQPAVPDEDFDLETLLEAALATLDASDRAVIEGKYFRGGSVRALAKEFQLSEKAVESRLARARARLRTELAKRLRDEEGI